MTDMPEEWKNCKEFPEKYEISSHGNVRKKKDKVNLTLYRGTKGYLYVSLYPGNNKIFSRRVHKLVLEAFSKRPDNCVINHIDGNRENNRLENLEFVSSRENACHARGVDRLHGTTFLKGCGKWQSRITVNGKRIFLGEFDTQEQAYAAYKEALKERGLENKYAK